jgi:hypothetical protein
VCGYCDSIFDIDVVQLTKFVMTIDRIRMGAREGRMMERGWWFVGG